MKPARVLLVPYGRFGGLYQSSKGVVFFALHLPQPGYFPGSFAFREYRIVALQSLRLTTIRDAVARATEAAEKDELTTEQLEIVLDYLFAEQGRRINK